MTIVNRRFTQNQAMRCFLNVSVKSVFNRNQNSFQKVSIKSVHSKYYQKSFLNITTKSFKILPEMDAVQSPIDESTFAAVLRPVRQQLTHGSYNYQLL